MAHLQASDLLHEAEENGQRDPYLLLSRLKNELGISDARGRELLRMRNYAIDDLIDARCDTRSSSRSTGGFVRNYS